MKFSGKTFIDVYADGKKIYTGLGQKGYNFEYKACEVIQFRLSARHVTKVTINGRQFLFNKNKKSYNKTICWKQADDKFDEYFLVMKDF